MASERIAGKVKWYNRKKGFGYLTPDAEGNEEVFVHASSVTIKDGLVLDEGTPVEFSVGADEQGRAKACDVTAIGGGEISEGRERRARRTPTSKSEDGEEAGGGENAGVVGEDGKGSKSNNSSSSNPRKKREKKAIDPFWHASLSPALIESIAAKSIPMDSGTLDVKVGNIYVKLGTGGYLCCNSFETREILEGTFTHDEDGNIKLSFDKHITLSDGGAEWKAANNSATKPVSDFSMADISALADTPNLSNMGENVADPAECLAENSFKMKRVFWRNVERTPGSRGRRNNNN